MLTHFCDCGGKFLQEPRALSGLIQRLLMRITVLLFLISLLFGNGFCSMLGQGEQVQSPLTTEEKLADFEFLYTELEQSYPYFGVNKRLHDHDWLGNKDQYLRKVRATANDKEYIGAIQEIVLELHNGHTDLYPTMLFDYFYNGYSSMVDEHPELVAMVSEMERFGAKDKIGYWQNLLHELSENGKEGDMDAPTLSSTTISTTVHGRTLVVNLPSFSYERIDADAKPLKRIFRKARKYEHLILNIQGNSGGSESYWHEHIVGHLINKEVAYPIVMAFKQSDRLKRMKPSYAKNLTYEEIRLPNLPEELSSGDFIFSRDTNSITPVKGSKLFAGNIYLLVDEAVYSSAESLAHFCKVTSFAKVVGQTTSGDGIGSDPLLMTLPKSGIIIRFTGEMGLNPDGSANEETKTVPDVVLTGNTPQQRLKQLLKRIEEQ